MNADILTSAPNGKKAVLTVGFGTLSQEATGKFMGEIAGKVKAAFPGYEWRQAVTSRIMAAKAPFIGHKTETAQQALLRLQTEGYTEVIVQSLHIIAGQEFEKLKEAVNCFSQDCAFEKITLGRPLLYYLGQDKKPDDYQAVVEAIAKDMPVFAKDEAAVMQGHDGTHPANSSYGALQLKFIDSGYKNIHICTMKGYPNLTNIIGRLKAAAVKKVILAPLMLAAGGHAANDMAGDRPGSAKNLLLSAGFKVEVRFRGLGENRCIQDIFIRHARDAAENCTP